MLILIVDDDNDIRILLSRTLQKWGHEVVSAKNGMEAWEILKREVINFVISDWMMPVMDGLELCKKIRTAAFPRYVYVILLTAKDEKDELVKGMEAGADDFVVKPFNKGELNVRIRAGERILKLEHDLEEHNIKLKEVNKNLKKAYSVISKDLEAAATIQKSLLPASALTLSGFKFDWLFSPCSFVAGDIFNFFHLDDHHIGFYLLDVAGHGIPAAMTSVTLSRILSPSPYTVRPLKIFIPDPPHYEIASPEIAIRELNMRFQSEKDAMQYFTMVYGIIDTKTSNVQITLAGHPSPVCLRRDGQALFIGSGGFPVGMLPDVEYEVENIELQKGDRLFLYSDGVTECTNEDMEQFSEKRLMNMLKEKKPYSLRDLLADLEKSLYRWKGKSEFYDDITLLAVEKI